jgi:hypothetical protein
MPERPALEVEVESMRPSMKTGSQLRSSTKLQSEWNTQ